MRWLIPLCVLGAFAFVAVGWWFTTWLSDGDDHREREEDS